MDDNSPDGTGGPGRRARQENDPRIHCSHRPGKMGLGSAYVAGFRYALRRAREYVFEMDADFSHDPEAIGDFLRRPRTRTWCSARATCTASRS